MKRPQPPGPHFEEFVRDIKQTMGVDTLSKIGAISLAYNYAEHALDLLLHESAGLSPALAVEIATRINGSDGKVAIIRKAIESEDYTSDAKACFHASLDGFGEYKRYRDGVIHSRVHDSAKGIGFRVERQGKITQVLFTNEALDGLYNRLNILRTEIQWLHTLSIEINENRRLAEILNGVLLRRHELRHSTDYAKYVSQAQLHQKKRLSLPPLPTFPG